MTENRTTELLPCPFCGSYKAYPNHELGKHWIECRECTAESGCYRTEAEAIAAWNTRTPVEYEGWFYLPKPKNSLVHYGTPQIEKTENCYKAKQSVEVIESAIRAWGDELGEHIMKRICEVWNTSTHGTLTAEQVRDAVLVNFEETHETRYDHWEPSKFDWQAIADELNATLGGGECENIAPDYLDFLCSKCGFVHYHSDENDTGDGNDWNHCPNCGKAVKR